MPTPKEKALVRELVELAMEVNGQGVYDVNVTVRRNGVDMHISLLPVTDSSAWSFYGENTPYFSGHPWTEQDFTDRIGVFIHEAKKHHADYDEDGIKL